MYAVLFFASISGALWAVWWRIEGKVDRAKAEAVQRADEAQREVDAVARDLSSLRLHVAEHYVSKAGHRESTEQIMQAISGVKSAVDAMTLRIDRVVEGQPKPRTTRAG